MLRHRRLKSRLNYRPMHLRALHSSCRRRLSLFFSYYSSSLFAPSFLSSFPSHPSLFSHPSHVRQMTQYAQTFPCCLVKRSVIARLLTRHDHKEVMTAIIKPLPTVCETYCGNSSSPLGASVERGFLESSSGMSV